MRPGFVLMNLQKDVTVVHGGISVPDGIFYDRLENQRRKAQCGQILRYFDHLVDRLLETGFGQGEVVIYVGKLLLKGNKGFIDGQALPEVIGQYQNCFPRTAGIGAAESRDGIERVIKKSED